MRAAPAFSLPTACGRAERAAVALLGGLCASAVAAAVWAHADAAAGFAGLGAWRWFVVVFAAGLTGAGLGWCLAPRSAGMLHWQRGSWTLVLGDPGVTASAGDGTVRPMWDLGSWMLLCFTPADRSGARWLCVNEAAAGAAWHPLRATLFAPGAGGPPQAPADGAGGAAAP